MKKLLSLIIASVLLVTTAFAAAVSDFSDIPDNWAKDAIVNAIENGLLNGSNGKVNPEGNLTRAEMAAIIVRATNAQTMSETVFSDVNENDWFYNEISKAVGMKVFYGSNGMARPNDPITREETMAVLCRMLKLENVDTNAALAAFADADSVSTWARDNVASMITSGYIQGSNGKINPKSYITRAEFATIMDRMVTTYISTNDSVSENLENVMINTVEAELTLENMTVSGNLIIGDGVGEGCVWLKNVKVEGRLLVRGGGVNSIHVVNNSTVGELVVAKPNGDVRIVTDSEGSISSVRVADGGDVTIEANVPDIYVDSNGAYIHVIESEVGNVEIHDDNNTVHIKTTSSLDFGYIAEHTTNSKIIIDGSATAGKVVIDGNDSQLEVKDDAKVESVVANGENAQITVNDKASVEKVEANESGTNVTGSGDVDKVEVPADKKDEIKVETEGTQIIVKGEEQKPDDKPNTGVGVGGGGSSTTTDQLLTFAVYGVKGGVADSVLANVTASNDRVVVDLSALALDDVITHGKATTTYGSDLIIGSYHVPTNNVVTFNDLLSIVASSTQTDKITIGALRNLVSDTAIFNAIFEAKTGNSVPDGYMTITGNKFTVKANLSLNNNVRTVYFEIILPA